MLGEVCPLLLDSLLCFESLGYGPCRDVGVRAKVENQGGSAGLLLECISPSREKNAFVPGH